MLFRSDAAMRLVKRLDGLPLAIELAASRTRFLSVVEIESRLTESFTLLKTRNADIPLRQQTLEATLEWSYNRLSNEEKNVLRCVSVFVGGFGSNAADALCDDDALDTLASLEEQSLVQCRRADKGEPPRFYLLQTVADFARRKAQETPNDLDAAKAKDRKSVV